MAVADQPRSARKTSTYVALLRGINLGGRNRVPMRDLADLFTAAGCRNVRTHIQSGNVVLQAAPPLADRIPELIGKSMLGRFGFSVPIVMRTRGELDEIVRRSPFVPSGADPEKLHVVFLATRPSRGAVASIDAHRSPPDEFVVRDREVYLLCPQGYGRTKLTNEYFDRTLATTSTTRNWRTVITLLELAQE
jgi:uncharacterized protein (DUF1697 family)